MEYENLDLDVGIIAIAVLAAVLLLSSVVGDFAAGV